MLSLVSLRPSIFIALGPSLSLFFNGMMLCWVFDAVYTNYFNGVLIAHELLVELTKGVEGDEIEEISTVDVKPRLLDAIVSEMFHALVSVVTGHFEITVLPTSIVVTGENSRRVAKMIKLIFSAIIVVRPRCCHKPDDKGPGPGASEGQCIAVEGEAVPGLDLEIPMLKRLAIVDEGHPESEVRLSDIKTGFDVSKDESPERSEDGEDKAGKKEEDLDLQLPMLQRLAIAGEGHPESDLAEGRLSDIKTGFKDESPERSEDGKDKKARRKEDENDKKKVGMKEGYQVIGNRKAKRKSQMKQESDEARLTGKGEKLGIEALYCPGCRVKFGRAKAPLNTHCPRCRHLRYMSTLAAEMGRKC